jgi:hypothetical protein
VPLLSVSRLTGKFINKNNDKKNILDDHTDDKNLFCFVHLNNRFKSLTFFRFKIQPPVIISLVLVYWMVRRSCVKITSQLDESFVLETED